MLQVGFGSRLSHQDGETRNMSGSLRVIIQGQENLETWAATYVRYSGYFWNKYTFGQLLEVIKLLTHLAFIFMGELLLAGPENLEKTDFCQSQTSEKFGKTGAATIGETLN